MLIRPFLPADIPAAVRVWNECVRQGEVLYAPMTEERFGKTFFDREGCEPDCMFAAEKDGRLCGFVHGVPPESFRGGKPGNAYLTVLLDDSASRGQGVGKALLETLCGRMKARGAATLFISSVNPVNLSWIIPDTPGHDHNNMPGLDEDCAGAGFFLHEGFERRYSEVAMYIDLSDYRMSPKVPALQEKLRQEGIVTGPYDPALHCGFDRLCDRVGSEYWHDVLRTEIAAWEAGEPNADSRFWADGIRPAGPRVLLTATHEGEIVGFTGPVDLQKSGRGWFTGICTDPEYGRRGIATALFNLLLQAFREEGAQFTTLFTGMENPAKKIYTEAGLRPARAFTLMAKPLD